MRKSRPKQGANLPVPGHFRHHCLTASPISTRDLSRLGGLSIIERVSQSIAVLDAILSPEWDYRFFSFNAAWDPANRERMASMRDGSGDEYFAVFSLVSGILKGLHTNAP